MRIIFSILVGILSLTACVNPSSDKAMESTVVKNDTSTLIQAELVLPQGRNESGYVANLTFGCTYDQNTSKNRITLYYPDDRAIEEIKAIVTYSGLPMNFEIYGADINNAMATTVNGKRLILYDSELFAFTDHISNTNWTSVSILAHEIGHHLSGHTLNQALNKESELEADKFSGFVLYKMGATKEQSISAMQILGTNAETSSHPNKHRRIEAILLGWEEAAKLRYHGAIPPPPLRQIPEIIYTTKMLYGTEVFMDGDIPIASSMLYEGTITEVDPDYNAGGVEIYTEKVVRGTDDIGIIGKREMFNAPITMELAEALDNSMSHSEWSWMEEVFKSGRRVHFSYATVGSGGHLYLTYIKVIR